MQQLDKTICVYCTRRCTIEGHQPKKDASSWNSFCFSSKITYVGLVTGAVSHNYYKCVDLNDGKCGCFEPVPGYKLKPWWKRWFRKCV